MWENTPFSQPRSSFEQSVTPPDVDPDTGGLVSVYFNPAWLAYVLGALTQLQQPTTWTGTDAEKQLAVDRAILLSNLIGYPIAAPPPGQPPTPPPLTRYDSGCDCVQTSIDGGATWTDTPGADPREQSPLAPQTGVNSRCNSAASERKYLVRFSEVLQITGGTGVTATGLAYSILALLTELSGPWAIIFDVIVGASLGLLSAGLTAINSALSDTNLDLLECILYCQLDSLNRLSDVGLTQIQAAVTAQIGGTDATIINLILALQGFGGINSAMALKLDTDDCSGCASCNWSVCIDLTWLWGISSSMNAPSGCPPTFIFSPQGVLGTYGGHVAWVLQKTLGDGANRIARRFNLDLPSGSTLTKVEFWLQRSAGNIDQFTKSIWPMSGSATCYTGAFHNNPQTATLSLPGPRSEPFEIGVGSSVASDSTTMAIDQIKITGTGPKPNVITTPAIH